MSEKLTESASDYRDLEKMDTLSILRNINKEDQKVPLIIEQIIPEISKFVDAAWKKLSTKGRLFYIGSGTSGRLGIVDASECPPTYGVDHGKVIGIIAGGDKAIRKAQEFAEDDLKQGWNDLKVHNINSNDVIIGLSASGSTPYVVGALKTCRDHGILTACICCNKNTPLEIIADFPLIALTGAEFVTGSTRMKAGTAQKLILNMISTSIMIKLGRVQDNKMVDMQLTNQKLIERGTNMIKELTGWTVEKSKLELLKNGSVRKVIEQFFLNLNNNSKK